MKTMRVLLWIAGLTLAITAPIQLYRFHRALGFISPFIFLYLLLSPILLIGIAWMLTIKSSKELAHGFAFFGLIIFVFYGLLTLGMENLLSIRPISNIQKYEKVLNQWKEFAPDIVAHFPESIPPDVQNVGFYFAPGFLQADSEVQLRFKTSSKKIQEYYEKISKLKTKSYFGRRLVHFVPHKKDGVLIELNEEYETLQFDEDPNHIPEHGKEHGVIISKKQNEIIFGAEW